MKLALFRQFLHGIQLQTRVQVLSDSHIQHNANKRDSKWCNTVDCLSEKKCQSSEISMIIRVLFIETVFSNTILMAIFQSSCCPTNSIKALKANCPQTQLLYLVHVIHSMFKILQMLLVRERSALADPYCQSMWMSVSLFVSLSVTLRSNISETKGDRG